MFHVLNVIRFVGTQKKKIPSGAKHAIHNFQIIQVLLNLVVVNADTVLIYWDKRSIRLLTPTLC